MANPRPPPKVNRRLRNSLSRAHLLDVRMRTSTTRRRRQQTIARWVTKLFLIATISAAAFFGLRTALDRFFFRNAEYTLRRISFDLDGILTREEALAATGLHEGVNIFTVDLAKVEAALREIPQVQDVRLDRKLPDQIDVSVTARRPVAWVAAPDEKGDPSASEKSLLVDASGFLLRPRRVLPEYFHLPAIYGVKSDNVRNGETLPGEDLRLALQLIETLARHPESLLHIRTIDISRGYCIEVVNDANARILFATSDFEEQLARLQQLLEHCDESGRALESVNLMVKRNTPVTFVASATTPPEVPPAAAVAVPQQPAPKTRKN
ncbi:MAG: FtsQ-type POTRA domain-containing protein [Terrimicrobiaceae bacterium]